MCQGAFVTSSAKDSPVQRKPPQTPPPPVPLDLVRSLVGSGVMRLIPFPRVPLGWCVGLTICDLCCPACQFLGPASTSVDGIGFFTRDQGVRHFLSSNGPHHFFHPSRPSRSHARLPDGPVLHDAGGMSASGATGICLRYTPVAVTLHYVPVELRYIPVTIRYDPVTVCFGSIALRCGPVALCHTGLRSRDTP